MIGNVPQAPTRVMFLYWGRRGLTQFTYEIAQAAIADNSLFATISVSRQNESFEKFNLLGPNLFAIDTFSLSIGAIAGSWRIPIIRRQLAKWLLQDRTQIVIELMPHIWSPFIADTIRRAGARYVTIVHDADTHPGDYRTGAVKTILDRAICKADLVFTLSEAVAGRVASLALIPSSKICTLYHPNLTYCSSPIIRTGGSSKGFRVLFLGRIMPYKGLPILLDAVELLRSENIPIEIGVLGEGPLGLCADRLRDMGAEVVNRWLSDEEIAAALQRFDAVVLPYVEASQSGIAALALGAGLPVVASPVGGLLEQIVDGETGIIAHRTDAAAIASAVKRLATNISLCNNIRHNILKRQGERSMPRFITDCVNHALHYGRS